MSTRRRALRLGLCCLCCLGVALAWLANSLTPSERTGWSLTNASRTSQNATRDARDSARPAQLTDREAAIFDHAFAPVPQAVWTDRQAPLPEAGLHDVRDRLRAAGLHADDLRRERTRLGSWLASHRADTALDLPGAWQAARRFFDRELKREYETNRRKRKLLGELLAGLAE